MCTVPLCLQQPNWYATKTHRHQVPFARACKICKRNASLSWCNDNVSEGMHKQATNLTIIMLQTIVNHQHTHHAKCGDFDFSCFRFALLCFASCDHDWKCTDIWSRQQMKTTPKFIRIHNQNSVSCCMLHSHRYNCVCVCRRSVCMAQSHCIQIFRMPCFAVCNFDAFQKRHTHTHSHNRYRSVSGEHHSYDNFSSHLSHQYQNIVKRFFFTYKLMWNNTNNNEKRTAVEKTIATTITIAKWKECKPVQPNPISNPRRS